MSKTITVTMQPIGSRRNTIMYTGKMRQILCQVVLLAAGLFSFAASRAAADERAAALIEAARAQIGVTRFYDSAYRRLDWPNGDIDMERGVCSDVVIRAYRRAFQHDLQVAVHRDMKRTFSAYPKNWGLNAPDRNIDHRRVPNLQVFLARHGARLKTADAFQPGDLVTQTVAQRLPHIAIVSDRRSADGQRYLVIHNIGAGAVEEDTLSAFPITGHYRYFP